jgi:hypothetical protein
VRALLPLLLFAFVTACSGPARPAAKPTAPPPTRAAPRPTATPDPAAAAFGMVVTRIDESPLPPVEPTPVGFTSGRATATPFATPEAAWKYVTITFAIENRSDAPHLVGIAGDDSTTTNLSGAVLTARDGTRYKPIHSTTSFGMRSATSHALTTYPVLLPLPPGMRAAGESAGSLSVVAPSPSTLTFKVPADSSDYGTLSIPRMTNLGPKTDDDVTRLLRPLIGGFQPLDLGGMGVGAQQVAYPTVSQPAPQLPSIGTPLSIPGSATVTLTGVDVADPQDFEVRNRGWKQVTLSLQYHNDGQDARPFNVVAWLFGEDGIVYTGDAPSIGGFGSALTAPPASALLLWDGRFVGTDQTPAGQALEPRRAVFLVPRNLHNGVLVLAGDVSGMFSVANITTPAQP